MVISNLPQFLFLFVFYYLGSNFLEILCLCCSTVAKSLLRLFISKSVFCKTWHLRIPPQLGEFQSLCFVSCLSSLNWLKQRLGEAAVSRFNQQLSCLHTTQLPFLIKRWPLEEDISDTPGERPAGGDFCSRTKLPCGGLQGSRCSQEAGSSHAVIAQSLLQMMNRYVRERRTPCRPGAYNRRCRAASQGARQ